MSDSSTIFTPVEPGAAGSRKQMVVSSNEELLDSVRDPTVSAIVVAGDLHNVSSVRLAPGVSLRAQANVRPAIRFAPDVDGICVTSDNAIEDIDLFASDERCAIWNDQAVTSLGTLALRRVNTSGRVRILAHGNVRGGHVIVEGLVIRSADARREKDRPHEFGVDVLQGAFTLWNLQKDQSVVITAELVDLAVGRFGAPVLGSGIFVSGAGENAGRVEIQHLRTGPVYSDGRIEPGTPGLISGGVFVVYSARVDLVENLGPVTTYGPNDMALDNWGIVDRWISKDKVTTFGPSGVGFVNFGFIDHLRMDAPIETFGQGARGFNVYTGTIRSGDFDRIVTHGDGAVGVQISQPVGKLFFHRGIETRGATGNSLVKGVVMKLPATALSIKPGGSAESIRVEGGLRTHGAGVHPLEQDGSIGSLHIEGGCEAGLIV
jgi:hypothetical protein